MVNTSEVSNIPNESKWFKVRVVFVQVLWTGAQPGHLTTVTCCRSSFNFPVSLKICPTFALRLLAAGDIHGSLIGPLRLTFASVRFNVTPSEKSALWDWCRVWTTTRQDYSFSADKWKHAAGTRTRWVDCGPADQRTSGLLTGPRRNYYFVKVGGEVSVKVSLSEESPEWTTGVNNRSEQQFSVSVSLTNWRRNRQSVFTADGAGASTPCTQCIWCI